MKSKTLSKLTLSLALAISALDARSQLFNSGSDGSLGALVTTNGQVPLNMPSNGVFNFTTITVNPNHTLKFNRNPLNTPVYLLATGDVVINGAIDVSGSPGSFAEPGLGGPGGFNGARAGGDGQGPGGGRAGADGGGISAAGGGAYATAPTVATPNKGAIYGSDLVIPLTGGSGGGGNSFGGGGGGGAILIASSTSIQISGAIYANHGGVFGGGINGGSGGAIRLVAPSVSGGGRIDAFEPGSGVISGGGRVRIDVMDRTGLSPQIFTGSYSIGSFMTVFPPGNPRLDIIQAADTTIPEGTNAPVTILLPFGSDTNRTVTVQARNFGAVVPIEVAITPQLGSSFRIQTNIDNSTINPATVTVPVAFPVNTPTAVHAWTR